MKRKSLPRSTRFMVLMRDSFTCQYCGVTAKDSILHVDHLVPVSAGGSDCEDNLITACMTCNSGKSSSLLARSSELVIDAAAACFEREQIARELARSIPQHNPSLPVNAPDHVVEMIDTPAQALAVAIAAGHHKLDYIAALIGKSKAYVSRLQRGLRPIPDKLVKPLCAATGSNLLAQVIALHAALEDACPVERLAQMLRESA